MLNRIGKKIENFVLIQPLIWFILSALTILSELIREKGAPNNFVIFRQVFWHTIEKKNLYLPYPAEYFDLNHYGPLFSLLIAPFAIIPPFIGCFFWGMANATALYFAVQKLPLEKVKINIILLISLVELQTSLHNVQYNPMVATFIILSYVFIEQKKELWATFFIMVGLLTKIYGVAGLVFFFFSSDKVKFFYYSIFWFIVLTIIPVVLSSPEFLIQTYKDWWSSLVYKNSKNATSSSVGGMQDISVFGLIRRIGKFNNLKVAYILLPAVVLYILPLFRIVDWKNKTFQLLYLSLTLISVVIFSSAAESPTYIIAIAGVGIWYVIQKDLQLSSKQKHVLLIIAIIFTVFASTDLFPPSIRKNLFTAYSIKALPCLLIWLTIVAQLLFFRTNLNEKKV